MVMPANAFRECVGSRNLISERRDLSLRPRSLDSGRWGAGQSSLIKTDTFTYQNHDLEAIGSEGSFACR